jgi:hypothetical protein
MTFGGSPPSGRPGPSVLTTGLTAFGRGSFMRETASANTTRAGSDQSPPRREDEFARPARVGRLTLAPVTSLQLDECSLNTSSFTATRRNWTPPARARPSQTRMTWHRRVRKSWFSGRAPYQGSTVARPSMGNLNAPLGAVPEPTGHQWPLAVVCARRLGHGKDGGTTPRRGGVVTSTRHDVATAPRKAAG